MDAKLFVILGCNGLVASLLAKHFAITKQNYISIPWASQSVALGIPGVSQGGISSSELRTLISDCHPVIFIDCLWGSNDFQSELKLHASILTQIHDSFPEARYCLISTFEANTYSPSMYRDTKYRLEKFVIGCDEIVLRIGLIRDSPSFARPPQLISIDLRLLLYVPILIPVTYACDLVDFLCSYDDWSCQGRPILLRAYSQPIPLRLGFAPLPCLSLSPSRFVVPLIIPPAFFLRFILISTWSIFRPFQGSSFFSKLCSQLQRIYSLLEQQPAIMSYDKWLLK